MQSFSVIYANIAIDHIFQKVDSSSYTCVADSMYASMFNRFDVPVIGHQINQSINQFSSHHIT